MFQSKQLRLTKNWTEINIKYAKANAVLGDIPKVTLSSKVLGDLDQFMIYQDMSLEDVSEREGEMAFPESVVQYLRGEIDPPSRVFV